MPYLVVAYDISDHRRRWRLARALWGMLDRVQRSVFEGEVTEDHQRRLEERIRRIVAEDLDTVRIYTLCPACRQRIRGIGPGAPPEPQDFWIV